jgi:prolipoprotein diacylglyceryl transferase
MNILLSAITNYSSPIGEAGRSLLFINWNPSLNFGPFRWYSLCWLIGLALAYFIVRHLFYEQGIAERTIKKNGKKEVENVFDPLFIYCFLGILIGARLGHCLFYQPDYFLTSGKHIVEMLLPIHFMADGGWKFTGYEGLASHGGTLGLIIALWLYVRYSKISIWTVLDNIAIATGTTACFIRLGNLMNSEIIGKITDVPWAFIFERVDSFPRHPGQLYEAIAYAVLFFIMWAIYKRSKKTDSPKVGTGWYFGFCLFYIFTFRFLIEYTKDVQEAWEADMLFNMGQLLSIPFIIIGVWCMLRAKKKS